MHAVQEVEKEAERYFKDIYTGRISIAEILALLAGFKNSGNPREQEVFECMVQNLFEEYRYRVCMRMVVVLEYRYRVLLLHCTRMVVVLRPGTCSSTFVDAFQVRTVKTPATNRHMAP